MVEIRSNLSFAGWFEVIFNGQVIEEVQGRNKALRLAKEVARKNKIDFIAIEGKIIQVEQ
jgi:hypothetical protein